MKDNSSIFVAVFFACLPLVLCVAYFVVEILRSALVMRQLSRKTPKLEDSDDADGCIYSRDQHSQSISRRDSRQPDSSNGDDRIQE